MSEFITSSISSIIACYITYPIDMIKTRYQVKPDTLRAICKDIGKPNNYYTGIRYNLMTYPIFWGVYFQTSEGIKGWNDSKLFCSLGGAAMASFVTNPLFILKTRYQTGNINNSFKSIVKNEGMNGLLKGLPSTLAANMKFGIQFPLYDHLRERNYGVVEASFVSKILTSSLFYPFDYVRTIQRNDVKKINMWKCFSNIIGQYGVKGVYKGLGLYTLTTLPNFVIMMWVKELWK